VDERVARFIERIEHRYWGKYRGVVVDRDDPEHLGRVKVRVPSVLGDAVTGWAWPVTPYAGVGTGFFFVPQVDDLVWVEFAEGDLDHPLWTGGGWAKPGGTTEIPPEADRDYPDRAVLRTRSGHEIVFCDVAGAETLIIRSTSGCEIELDAANDRVTIRAAEVVVRHDGGAAELATKSFVKDVFDFHTHATGVGPSGPPTLKSNATSLTSVLKAE